MMNETDKVSRICVKKDNATFIQKAKKHYIGLSYREHRRPLWVPTFLQAQPGNTVRNGIKYNSFKKNRNLLIRREKSGGADKF